MGLTLKYDISVMAEFIPLRVPLEYHIQAEIAADRTDMDDICKTKIDELLPKLISVCDNNLYKFQTISYS